MGMYTDLYFSLVLRSDTPPDVTRMLSRPTLHPGDTLLKQGFFQTERWMQLLDRCHSFAGDAGHGEALVVSGQIKNYQEEIQLFLSWIGPFLDARPGDFLGYFRGDDLTLVFYERSPYIRNVALLVVCPKSTGE